MAGTVSIRDKDIISKSFRMMSKGAPSSDVLEKLDWDRYFNVFSSAVGDNRYLNPVPQFSPATDPRYTRYMNTREGGMGSMYKEMYDDNATLLTLTPGVPEFAGLLNFINNMFDPVSAVMANKGRAPSFTFYLGQAAGAIAFWPMQLFSISWQFIEFLADTPRNQFYSVKPTPGTYIMAANGVLNDMLVKLGYIDPVLPKNTQEQTDPLYKLKPDYDPSGQIRHLQNLFPDVINPDGTIDLMRMVMRGARKYRYMIDQLAKVDNAGGLRTVDDKYRFMQNTIENMQFSPEVRVGAPSQEYVEKEMGTVGQVRPGEGMFTETASAYTNRKAYMSPDNGAGGSGGVGATNGQGTTQPLSTGFDSSGTYGNQQQAETAKLYGAQDSYFYQDDPNDRSWLGNIKDLVQTAARGGLDAITLRVEAGGAVTDSFSNTHTPSPMADKFNSMVKAANDFRFDVQGGNTGIGIIDGVVNMFKDGVQGLMAGTVVGNIPLALTNNSYIKVPDHWENSSVNLHRETFTITSQCNYAHPYEQVTKIWTLFSLILPMVAGFSAGGAAYTSPFMVKAFSKSRTIIRHGMVESARFTFGEGDAGWTRDRKPLNIKIELEIVDLDPLVAVPINRGLSILDATNPAAALRKLTDDGAYTNYLTRLGGVDYLDTVLRYARINRMLTMASLDIKQSFRSENIASKISDSVVGDVMKLFHKQMAR